MAYVVVFTGLLMNLALLVAAPRIHDRRLITGTAPNKWSVMYEILAERPLITILLILQLLGLSEAAATTVKIIQATGSAYVRTLPNSHSTMLRLIGALVTMTGVTGLWLLGAIGLWRRRNWAWWLVLVLNGLSATVSGALQMLTLNQFLLDIPATITVVLLLLRSVRTDFRGAKAATGQVAI